MPGPRPLLIAPRLKPVAAQALHYSMQPFGGGFPRRYRWRGDQTDAREYAPHDASPSRHRRAFVPGKETAPQPAQRERHDGHGRAIEDLLHPRLEGAQLAVIGDLALRKDADQVAVLERFGDLVVRLVER